MADGILSDIAGRLIEQFGSLVIKEIGLAWGVKVEIRKLKDTIETIQAVLEDAEQLHSKNNKQVTLWLSKLKEVVYDADDLLDDFATELKQREVMTGNRMAKEVRIFFSTSNQLAYGLKMGHRIKDIREKIDSIQSNRQFHLDENRVRNIEREQTHSFVLEKDVIGRDEDKNAIIQRLLDSTNVESVSVIPIVGIGGLGKTTLAKLIYNDENIKNNFQLRMWVCVSDVFDVRIIIQNIIKSADGMNIGLDNMDQLRKHLLEQISGKKYLLVLDDIWNENRESWLKLETLLMNGMKGSTILVTTRSQRVAKITSKLPFHELRGLNEDQSWSLFTKMAFENGIEPNGSELVKIGKCIVKKCVGVPLAIRTIGRFLYYNYTVDYWLRFMENELSQIDDQEENDILPTLKLSYDHLPSQLKQCFAYCALFPKDCKIRKAYLVDLWMAQGFLWSSSTNQSLEVVGTEYFMNLLSRSFFQDVEYDDWGNVLNCKMHDLMHDLATKVTGSECNLLRIDATNYQVKARHISFDSTLDLSREIPTALLDKNHIRTFLLPYRYDTYIGDANALNESNFKKILSSFRCLRALDLIGSNIKKLPNLIGKLKYLRYLDLSYNKNIIELPNSMSRLKNLQILKLNQCWNLKELPKDLRKMVSLRCLMMEDCGLLIGIPRGVSSLTNLRTLSRFVLGSKSRKYAELYELDGLNNLSGELEIRGLENARSKHTLANCLKAKYNLKSLKLAWPFGLGDEIISSDEEVLECLQPHPNLKDLRIKYFMGTRISSWLSSLTNLTSIEIFGCMRCQNIPRLDQLPSLQSLYLGWLHKLEYMISANGSNGSSSTPSSTSFFPSLKKLTIEYCPNLKGWWRVVDNDNDDGAMELPSFPCLSQLDISDCPRLTCMPLYPSLEELRLRDSSLGPLEQTMKLMDIATPSTSSTVSAPFSKLKSMDIRGCENLDFLINVDDKQWKGFTSLNSITVSKIRELVSLPQGLQHVPNLRKLTIWDCPKLMDIPEGIQLNSLEIRECENLDFLTIVDDKHWKGFTSLYSITFSDIRELVSLPQGLQHVPNLQNLKIERCPKLMDLPEGMQLQVLKIEICPQLLERCGNNKGFDWPKISHIPNIYIDGDCIQKEGCYILNNTEGCSSASTVS